MMLITVEIDITDKLSQILKLCLHSSHIEISETYTISKILSFSKMHIVHLFNILKIFE